MRGLRSVGAVTVLSSRVVPPVRGRTDPTLRPRRRRGPRHSPREIHKIRHVVVIMQENRSFDSYFGAFPGADGVPKSRACVPDPRAATCVHPFVDHRDVNADGPHNAAAARHDINGGRMNGFIVEATRGHLRCYGITNPDCASAIPRDVMGYHTQSDIPNYWYYARHYVLQDHMFSPNAGASGPAHLYTVSEWSAYCTKHNAPQSCVNNPADPYPPAGLHLTKAQARYAHGAPDLRLDRSHVPLAPRPRLVGLLRGERRGTRL